MTVSSSSIYTKEFLVDAIKASASTIIEHADSIASLYNDDMTNFDIWIRFPSDSLPTIDISTSSIPRTVREQLQNLLNTKRSD